MKEKKFRSSLTAFEVLLQRGIVIDCYNDFEEVVQQAPSNGRWTEDEADGNIRKINGFWDWILWLTKKQYPEPRTPNPEPDFEKFLWNGNTLDKSQKQLVWISCSQRNYKIMQVRIAMHFILSKQSDVTSFSLSTLASKALRNPVHSVHF